MYYAFVADLIVFFHLLYVIFAVGGELMIITGGVFKWKWIRNFPFRIAHLIAVVFVAIEALMGMICPLTEWEYRFRVLAGQQIDKDITFIGQIIRKIIFYNFPAWVFTTMYIGFAVIVILSIFIFPPIKKGKKIL